MSDNKWSFLAAVVGGVSGWLSSRQAFLTPETHERIAVLEERLRVQETAFNDALATVKGEAAKLNLQVGALEREMATHRKAKPRR